MLYNKHTPQNIDDVWFHKDIYSRLKIMSADNSIPHIIFYGASGSGKKTMLNIFLKMLYGENVMQTQKITYNVSTTGNKIKKEIISQSPYHIIINPTNTNYDKNLVHDIVKTYACTKIFDLIHNTRSKFRTIQISRLDNLTHPAQTSLRRMIEENADICRFIMWCENLSNVIEPLKSRCVCIRLSRPEPSDLFSFLTYVAASEHIDINFNDMNNIVKYSECNIEKSLMYLEYHKLGYGSDYEITNYTEGIKQLTKLILSKDIKQIEIIRDIFFNICITTYEGAQVMCDILKLIIQNTHITEQCKANIIIKTVEIEHNMVCGRREIVHFDAFVIYVMKII